MSTLILLRHGESAWNHQNRFAGWVDVPLTQMGEKQATDAGLRMKDLGVSIDCIFASSLMRAQHTALLAARVQGIIPIRQHVGSAMEKTSFKDDKEYPWAPLYCDDRLNERYYGDLQGLNKQAIGEKYGEDQLQIWRRSYEVPPPGGESLMETRKRVVSCFEEVIVPKLKAGQNVLIAAHGNSLRSLIMELEGLSGDDIASCEIGTGAFRTYRLSEEGSYERVA